MRDINLKRSIGVNYISQKVFVILVVCDNKRKLFYVNDSFLLLSVDLL